MTPAAQRGAPMQPGPARHRPLLIIAEFRDAPLSRTGARLVFENICRRHERGSVSETSNSPFDKERQAFSNERLTDASHGRLGHDVQFLEANGRS